MFDQRARPGSRTLTRSGAAGSRRTTARHQASLVEVIQAPARAAWLPAAHSAWERPAKGAGANNATCGPRCGVAHGHRAGETPHTAATWHLTAHAQPPAGSQSRMWAHRCHKQPRNRGRHGAQPPAHAARHASGSPSQRRTRTPAGPRAQPPSGTAGIHPSVRNERMYVCGPIEATPLHKNTGAAVWAALRTQPCNTKKKHAPPVGQGRGRPPARRACGSYDKAEKDPRSGEAANSSAGSAPFLAPAQHTRVGVWVATTRSPIASGTRVMPKTAMSRHSGVERARPRGSVAGHTSKQRQRQPGGAGGYSTLTPSTTRTRRPARGDRGEHHGGAAAARRAARPRAWAEAQVGALACRWKRKGGWGLCGQRAQHEAGAPRITE